MARKKVIRGFKMTPTEGGSFYITDSEKDKATKKFTYKKVNEDKEVLEEYGLYDTLKEANEAREKTIEDILIEWGQGPKKIVAVPVRPTGIITDSEVGSVVQKLDMYQVVNELMLEGRSKTDIYNMVKGMFELTWDDYQKVHTSAIEWYRGRIVEQIDLPMVIHNHVNVYEQIYQFFNDIGYTYGKNKALQYKEKLLGFHREQNIFEINQENTTVIEQEEDYDLSKLDKKQVERLDFLLNKIGKTEDKNVD